MALPAAIHANDVLAQPTRARLSARSRAPQPRGRPRDSWIVAPDARPDAGGCRIELVGAHAEPE